MKKLVIGLTGLLLFSGHLFAQENKTQKDPDERIIVNKKYDDNGNLIQYDSTYVHQWSSDSTFQFSFPDDNFFAGKGFPDLNDFFENFMNDSAFGGFRFPGNLQFNPFGDEDFFGDFQFPDSMMNRMPFDNDSSMYFYFSDSTGNFPPGFEFPNLKDFQKQFNDQFGNSPFKEFEKPQFNNEKQREEWEKMMEKHRKEMEELKKKWEEEYNKK